MFHELKEAHGLDNIVVWVQMYPLHQARIAGVLFGWTSSSDEPQLVPCRIVEERYKLADGYKIELIPLQPGFHKEAFYQLDLSTMLRQDGARLQIKFVDDVAHQIEEVA